MKVKLMLQYQGPDRPCAFRLVAFNKNSRLLLFGFSAGVPATERGMQTVKAILSWNHLEITI